MMKRIISLAASVAVLLSLSACRTGNVGMTDRNNGITNGGTNIGRTFTINNNNNNNATANYKDGVYTAFGNANTNGNDRATVTIRNGLISDIDLASVSQQESLNYGNATGARTNNQDITNNQNRYSNGNNTGTGTITGTGAGTSTGTNNTTGLGGVGTGTGTTANNTTSTGIGQTIDNATGDALSRTKTTLVNAIIQNQSSNVTINDNDTNASSKIGNWKLAVSRALEQARR
jgi:uncharacterized protein with FMN-binding domain